MTKILGKSLHEARVSFEANGEAARVFQEFPYKTWKSWRQERRAIGKAEHLRKGSNKRFVLSHVPWRDETPRELYEGLYCAPGEMENRMKEQQLYLFPIRTSCRTMRANQLRV